jgi:hypothetical protein
MAILIAQERLSHYPIPYRGVVESYKKEAKMYELADIFVTDMEDEERWHYKFWNYFWALFLLTVQVVGRQVKIEDIANEMIDCYLKMGYLMLRIY